MIWSDCYATLSLAAYHTSHIRLGTGVAIAGTRLAPVTAHSIASINKLAPGRTFLGIGTGHTAMRIMGQKPIGPTEFREYLRVVRGLLDGEEVDYTHNDETRPIRFQDRELGCLNLDDRVPVYVGANGPKALAATGAYGDGRISAGTEPVAVMRRNMEKVRRGAEQAGRTLREDFHTSVLTYSCILKPGETLASDRVLEETGAPVVSSLHFWYELMLQRGNDGFIQDSIRDEWEDYKRHVEAMPQERRHQTLHTGHCALLPEDERRFITPNMIRATLGLVGEPDEITEQIGKMEKAGLKEILLLPPQACARQNFRNFADAVI
jgi:alkanesulfonate monooxygenase SsuD/methylene tetrahydromethanopterin reductase-like flavin-dependent oxidoreductase (luciferase family)